MTDEFDPAKAAAAVNVNSEDDNCPFIPSPNDP
jgi:hypothetical protein